MTERKEISMRSGTRLSLFLAGLAAAAFLCAPLSADAGISVGIGINLPPAHVIHQPPQVIVVPGSYVYYIPDIDVDILFYGGYWYRPYESRWFRSRSYNGPWRHIVDARVPRALIAIPPDYRHAPPPFDPIPYGHLRKHWKRWEQERYWDRRDHEIRDRHDSRRDHRDERRHGRDHDRDDRGRHR